MPQFITTGSALTVLGALLGICLSVWSLMVGAALICHRRAELASRRIEGRPWRTFFIGIPVAAVLGLLAAALTASPNPLGKLLGLLVYALLVAIAASGAGGLALLVGTRVRESAAGLSDYGALSRGATLIVLACLAPLVGWFVVTPAVLLLSVGAGFLAICFSRNRAPASNAAMSSDSGAA